MVPIRATWIRALPHSASGGGLRAPARFSLVCLPLVWVLLVPDVIGAASPPRGAGTSGARPESAPLAGRLSATRCEVGRADERDQRQRERGCPDLVEGRVRRRDRLARPGDVHRLEC